MLGIRSSKKSSEPRITSPPDARKEDIRTCTPHARSRTVHTTLWGSLDREEQGGAGGCGGSGDEKGSGAADETDLSRAVSAVHNAPIEVGGTRKPPLEASPVVKNAQLLCARASAPSRMRSAFFRIPARARAHCFHH